MNVILKFHRVVKSSGMVVTVGINSDEISSIEECLLDPTASVIWLKNERCINITENLDEALEIWRNGK